MGGKLLLAPDKVPICTRTWSYYVIGLRTRAKLRSVHFANLRASFYLYIFLVSSIYIDLLRSFWPGNRFEMSQISSIQWSRSFGIFYNKLLE
jgi:hypothetical protein